MILYSNSCSFGEANQDHIIYPEIVADKFSIKKIINKGRAGSCNRRIIRSTLRDLIEIDNSNVVALIGLSFITRNEVWYPEGGAVDNDGDFCSTFVNFEQYDWSKGFTKSNNDMTNAGKGRFKNYYKEWLLHAYNPEAEITNLFTDIIMLRAFAKLNKIRLFVFNNTESLSLVDKVDYNAPFLKSLSDEIKKDDYIIDLWNFSFASYALELGHRPKDENKLGINGHPNANAHKDFGNYLIKYIEEKK